MRRKRNINRMLFWLDMVVGFGIAILQLIMTIVSLFLLIPMLGFGRSRKRKLGKYFRGILKELLALLSKTVLPIDD